MGATATIVATAAAGAAGSALVNNLLTPKVKAPTAPEPVAMPDPLGQEAAKRASIAEQFARRGRAASILTQEAPQKLGG